MPTTKSAEERVRLAERERQYNRNIKSAVKTAIRQVEEKVAAGDKEGAQEAYRQATSTLDKAAIKGVIKKNNAARRKSRLAKKLASM